MLDAFTLTCYLAIFLGMKQDLCLTSSHLHLEGTQPSVTQNLFTALIFSKFIHENLGHIHLVISTSNGKFVHTPASLH